jgi:hypothetical protein
MSTISITSLRLNAFFNINLISLISLISGILSFGVITPVEASLTHSKTMNTITKQTRSFPSLPNYERETKFEAVQKGFEERSNLFLKGKHFKNWTVNRPEQEILEEFKQIDEWRNQSWYSENTGELLVSRMDFMVAQDLLEKGYYRHPDIIAFQYNQTDGSYNSSTIVLNGYRFLAMEGPTEKNIKQFYKLLQNFQVTQLVRLAPASVSSNNSGNPNNPQESQTYPYWQHLKKNITHIQIPYAGIQKTFPVLYYFTDSWKDNKAIDTTTLLNLIQSVRKDADADNSLIACHCSSGVGRTGTFIAGYLLLQEIDRQIAAGVNVDKLDLSIEKIVMQLSMQRVYLVASPEQYLALYRLVDQYIKTK